MSLVQQINMFSRKSYHTSRVINADPAVMLEYRHAWGCSYLRTTVICEIQVFKFF